MQRKGRLETQGVPGAQTGRHDTGGQNRAPQVGGDLGGNGDLDSGLSGVTGTGHRALGAVPGAPGDLESTDRGGFGEERGQFGPGVGS